jgi:bis(5'-nucleosyl)-tetraphosphatase (symmetrical)
MTRTLVVGDVQGCADELQDLLSHVAFSRGADRLVSVGDLVNRGPKSLAVLRLVRDLGADVVLGNHETNLLATAAGLRKRGNDTFEDVLEADDRDAIFDWLLDRPEPLVILRDYVVVHAGLPPGLHLPDEARDWNEFVQGTWTSRAPFRERVASIVAAPVVRTLTRIRYCDEAGRVPTDPNEVDPPGFRPWFEHRAAGPRIAFGHWARLDPARAKRDDLRFLDTGCVYGGRLSGWLVEEDRMVSVPSRKAYVKVS